MNIYILVCSEHITDEYEKGDILGIYSTKEIAEDEELKREAMGVKCYFYIDKLDKRSYIRETLTRGFVYTIAMDVKTKEIVKVSEKECYRDINETNIERKYKEYFKGELYAIVATSPVSFDHAILLAKNNIDRITEEYKFRSEIVELFEYKGDI